MRLPWTPVPEDEYVESIRRVMAFWGRFRILLFSLHVLLICGIVWLAIWCVELLRQLAQPANAPTVPLVFVAALIVGLSFGSLFGHGVHGIITSIAGFRSERLLLKYHDRLSGSTADDDPNIVVDPLCAEPEYADAYQDNP